MLPLSTIIISISNATINLEIGVDSTFVFIKLHKSAPERYSIFAQSRRNYRNYDEKLVFSKQLHYVVRITSRIRSINFPNVFSLLKYVREIFHVLANTSSTYVFPFSARYKEIFRNTGNRVFHLLAHVFLK